MRIFIPWAFLCLIGSLLLGCDAGEHLDPIKDYKDCKINGFEMRIPRYFKRKADLDPHATLAYATEKEKEFFNLVLLEEDKATLKNMLQRKGYLDENASLHQAFYRMQFDAMRERSELKEEVAPRDTIVNELHQTRGAYSEDVSMSAADIYYFVTAIEGTEKLYWITIWTSSLKRNFYLPTVSHMLNSFRLRN